MNVTTATQVLGLDHASVGRDDLVGAWRRFARAHHPDRCPGDPGAAWRFATGREAFETLIDRSSSAGRDAGRRPTAAPAWCAAPDAHRALPYEMRPLHTREWRA